MPGEARVCFAGRVLLEARGQAQQERHLAHSFGDAGLRITSDDC